MSAGEVTNSGQPNTEDVLIDLAIECWRFQRLFTRALNKLDAGESLRFSNQQRYFVQRIDDCLSAVGLKLVNLEGHPYEPGSAVAALNAADFSSDDRLIIENMIEPIVMGRSGLLRSGTVMLRKDQGNE